MTHRLFDFEQILKHIEDNDCDIHTCINQLGHHIGGQTLTFRREDMKSHYRQIRELECIVKACKKISNMLSYRAYKKGTGQPLLQMSVSGRKVGGDFDTKSLCNN